MRSRVVLLLLLLAGVPSWAIRLDINVRGQVQRVYTEAEPTCVVSGLADLRAHYAEVRDLLPPPPFIMDDQWVARLGPEGLTTWPLREGVRVYFSPSGEYVVEAEQLRDAAGKPTRRQKQRLLSTDGKLWWEREGPGGRSTVLNNGAVLNTWADWEEARVSLAVLAPRSPTEVGSFLQAFLHPEVVPLAGVDRVLLMERNAITAVRGDGQQAWKLNVGDYAKGRHFSRAGLDPLGRGAYAWVRQDDKASSVCLVDPTTGHTKGFIAQDQRWYSLSALSPGGSTAVIDTVAGFTMVDWATGRPYSPPAAGAAFRPLYDGSMAVSDRPARMAAPLASGHVVVDGDGRTIWSNLFHARDRILRMRLDREGRRLAALVEDDGPKHPGLMLYGVVVYALPR